MRDGDTVENGMRVLQVVPHYLPAYGFGGPLQVAHQLGRALVGAGHEVTVCTTNLESPGKQLSVPMDEAVEVDGLRVYYEGVPCLERWGYSPGLRRRIAVEARGADVVLVHSHFQFAGWAGASVARRQSRPYVIFPHSSLRRAAIASSHSLLKSLYVRLLERRNIEGSLFVAFNAEEEMEDSIGSARGVVIPNGIWPGRNGGTDVVGSFRRAHPELHGKLLYGFLGRLDVKQKGLDALLQGYAPVARDRQDVHLVLAGPSEGDGREDVERWIDRLDLTGRVSLPGLLRPREKEAFLADIDAFALMSRYEGASMALVEAMAAGLPVLVTAGVGMCREIVRAGAGLMAAYGAPGVEAALRRALDEDWRKAAGSRARQLVLGAYTWDRIAAKLIRELAVRGVGGALPTRLVDHDGPATGEG